VGLAGAALGALSRRRLGRVELAIACALAAIAAKEVMNLYTWTLGASHTPAAFLAIAATALPFDLTDMVASFCFGLAFGPELARLLARMRARMNVSWEPVASGALAENPPADPPTRVTGLGSLGAAGSLMAVLLAGTVCLGSPRPAAAQSVPARRAVANPPTASAAASSLAPELSFLTGAQNADGGFGGAKGQSSSELYTAWAAMGLAAAGRNPSDFDRAGHSVLDSLRNQASTLQGLGDAERTILALSACGASAYSFAHRNLVAEVLSARASDDSFEHLVNLTAFAIFALRAVGHSASFAAIPEAAGWLERQQNSDGGFGFGAHGSPSDVDDTAAAVQALVDAGARNSHVLAAAAGFLTGAQNLDGGFPQQPGGESNAQSTAFAVQGLIAAGRNPGSVRRRGSRSPLGYLESLRAPGGSIRYSRTGTQTPVWVTAQGLIALAGRTFPVGP